MSKHGNKKFTTGHSAPNRGRHNRKQRTGKYRQPNKYLNQTSSSRYKNLVRRRSKKVPYRRAV